jgi:hypothetical protein
MENIQLTIFIIYMQYNCIIDFFRFIICNMPYLSIFIYVYKTIISIIISIYYKTNFLNYELNLLFDKK